jgi:hypothetical protein
MATNSKSSTERCRADSVFAFSDRRGSPRFRAICVDVKVVRDGDVSLYRARNISDTGIMLHTHAPLGLGEPVEIGLSEKLAIRGTVLWHNERCCGIQFEKPIDCTAVLKAGAEHKRDDRRGGGMRLAARRFATTYAENGIRAVRVANVSHRGMGLRHDGSLGPDMLLRLIVDSGIEREARVRWSREGCAGVRLLAPLSCEELARISGGGPRVEDAEPVPAMLEAASVALE